MSANVYRITVDTDVHVQQGKTINNQFSYMGHNVTKIYILDYLERGASMSILDISCFPAIHSLIFINTPNKEAIW